MSSFVQISPRRRGTTLIVCIAMIAILGTIATSMTGRFLNGRRAQQRTEIARAERLLLANARVVAAALLTQDAPAPANFTYEDDSQKIVLTFEEGVDSSTRIDVQGEGIHPLASLDATMVGAGSDSSKTPSVNIVDFKPRPVDPTPRREPEN